MGSLFNNMDSTVAEIFSFIFGLFCGERIKGGQRGNLRFSFWLSNFFTGFGFHPERKLSKYCFLSQAEKYGIYLRGFFTDNVSASVQYTLMKRSTWNTKKKRWGKIIFWEKKRDPPAFLYAIHTYIQRETS